MTDETKEAKLQEMRDQIEVYAKAKSERVFLEQFRKSRRAMLMKDAELQGHNSAAAQLREAERHKDYIELLDGLRQAVYEEEKARWELQIMQNSFEAWRTRMANARMEMQRYGT